MEERRRVWNQVNSYTDKVVKDLLLEQKKGKNEEYRALKLYHDNMKQKEFLEKKRVGDQYMKESFGHEHRSAIEELNSGSYDAEFPSKHEDID